jgi:predicted ester cyclase
VIRTGPADLIAEGDRVAWSVRATGTHRGDFMGIPATGRRVHFDSLNIGDFRDGRAYRHKVVMDLPALLAQLGLQTGPTP